LVLMKRCMDLHKKCFEAMKLEGVKFVKVEEITLYKGQSGVCDWCGGVIRSDYFEVETAGSK